MGGYLPIPLSCIGQNDFPLRGEGGGERAGAPLTEKIRLVVFERFPKASRQKKRLFYGQVKNTPKRITKR